MMHIENTLSTVKLVSIQPAVIRYYDAGKNTCCCCGAGTAVKISSHG